MAVALIGWMQRALQFCKTNDSHGTEVPNTLLCNPLDFKSQPEALLNPLKRWEEEEGVRSADLRREEAAIGEGEGSKNETLEN